MTHSTMRAALAVLPFLFVAAAGATDAARVAPILKPQVSPAVRTGSLDSLREAARHAVPSRGSRPLRPLRRLPAPDPAGARGSAPSADRAVQSHAASVGLLAVTPGSNVLGVGAGFVGPDGAFEVTSAPPDTVGAAGATQYVQVVNQSFAVFDKATKAPVLGPLPTNTLWQGFGGTCENDDDGDGIVVYDKAAQRWIISQFGVGSGAPFAQCVAVSKTSDATGGYWLYAFSTGDAFPDYPKIGVWPDAYYITFNIFGSDPEEGDGNDHVPPPTAHAASTADLLPGFNGSLLCAYDRAKMLTGAAATQQCFQLTPDFGGVLPSDLDGRRAPPPKSPNYMLNFGLNVLNLWKFHVDWVHPGKTTLTGPVAIPVADFVGACNFGGACVREKSAPIGKLDSLGDRLMYRVAYRNFGDHEALVASHAVDVGPSGRNGHTGVRWYELRGLATAPVVYQQATYSPDNLYRWMPSIAMDKAGDIAVGYSASGTTSDPSIRYAGRLASDPLNTLQAETLMAASGGAQRAGLDRWGDYSQMTLDPVDDCTFWYTDEYLTSSGTFNWSTRIGSFKFPTCH